MKQRRPILWILLVCLALVAAACTDDGADDTTTTGGNGETTTTQDDGSTDSTEDPGSDDPVTVRAGINNDEDTINPYTYVTGFPGWNMLTMQYDTLMQFDTNGEPQPWLAETVTRSDDLTEWTVTLVDGVMWDAGAPLKLADAKST